MVCLTHKSSERWHDYLPCHCKKFDICLTHTHTPRATIEKKYRNNFRRSAQIYCGEKEKQKIMAIARLFTLHANAIMSCFATCYLNRNPWTCLFGSWLKLIFQWTTQPLILLRPSFIIISQSIRKVCCYPIMKYENVSTETNHWYDLWILADQG